MKLSKRSLSSKFKITSAAFPVADGPGQILYEWEVLGAAHDLLRRRLERVEADSDVQATAVVHLLLGGWN